MLTQAHVEAARSMATDFVDDHLGGDDEAKEAVESADPFGGIVAENRAQAGAMQVVALIVALTVGALVAAFLLPIGIEEIANASTEDFSSGAEAMWNILDVIIVLAVFLFFIGIALKATNRV